MIYHCIAGGERTFIVLILAILMVAGFTINVFFLYLHQKGSRNRCLPSNAVLCLLFSSKPSSSAATYSISSCAPSSSSSSLTRGNTYTSFLNVASLITCCTAIPACIIYVTTSDRASASDVTFYVSSASYSLCINATNWIIMLISMDRIYAVTNPFKESWTSRLSNWCIILLWTVSIASSLVPVFEGELINLENQKFGEPFCDIGLPNSNQRLGFRSGKTESQIFTNTSDFLLKETLCAEKRRINSSLFRDVSLDMDERSNHFKSLLSLMVDSGEQTNEGEEGKRLYATILLHTKPTQNGNNKRDDVINTSHNFRNLEFVLDEEICPKAGDRFKMYSFRDHANNSCPVATLAEMMGMFSKRSDVKLNSTKACPSDCVSLKNDINKNNVVLNPDDVAALILFGYRTVCPQISTAFEQMFSQGKGLATIVMAPSISLNISKQRNTLAFVDTSMLESVCFESNHAHPELTGMDDHLTTFNICRVNEINDIGAHNRTQNQTIPCSFPQLRKASDLHNKPRFHFITEIISFMCSLVSQLTFIRTISAVVKKKKEMVKVFSLPAVTMAVAHWTPRGLPLFSAMEQRDSSQSHQQTQQQQRQHQQQQQQHSSQQRQRRKTIDVINSAAPFRQITCSSPHLRVAVNNTTYSSRNRKMVKISFLMILAYVINYGPHVILALAITVSDVQLPLFVSGFAFGDRNAVTLR